MLLNKVKDTLQRNNLLKSGDTVIIALSGGPDSVCLSHILKSLQKELKYQIVLAHLNHAIRGKAGDQDARFTEKFARKLNLPLFQAKLKKRPKNEGEARKLRYQFLERVRQKNKAQKVATAHTKDDQIETILLHLLRGTGLPGLSGIRYQNKRIIRPLLSSSRQEVLSYLQKNKLTFCLDKTNKDLAFTRNRVRHQLIPLLKKEFNPNLEKSLLNLSLIAREANHYIQARAKAFISKNPENLPLQSWQALPRALKRETLRQAIASLSGNLQDIYAVHIAETVNMLETNHGNKKKNLPHGLQILKKDGKISLTKS